MVFDGSVSEEAQASNSLVVPIPLFIVCEAGRKMRSNEAEAGAFDVESNSHRTFVASHTTHTGLVGPLASSSLMHHSNLTFFRLASTFLI